MSYSRTQQSVSSESGTSDPLIPSLTLYQLSNCKTYVVSIVVLFLLKKFGTVDHMRKPDFVTCKQQRCRPASASVQSDQYLYFSLSGCASVQSDQYLYFSLSGCASVQSDQYLYFSLSGCASVQSDQYLYFSLSGCASVQSDQYLYFSLSG